MSVLTHAWTRSDYGIGGCPVVASVDGAPRIVAGTSDGDLLMLDGAGGEVWRIAVSATASGAAVSAWPTIDDVPGVGPCILIGDEEGDILCASPSGEALWRTRLEGGMIPFNNVAVVRGADISFVASDRRGVVTGLTADGGIAWEFHTHRERIWRAMGVGPCAVGDLDGDGSDEIVFSASDGRLYCLGADGAFRWNVYVGANSQYSAHVLADLGDGPCVISGGTSDIVRCISPDGQVMWEQRGAGAGFIEGGISIGDIDGDGSDEIVFVHQGRALQAVDGDGSMLWSTFDYVGGDQPFGPSIGDLDGDGSMEFILAQRGGGVIRVIRSDGSLLEEHDLPGSTLGAPTIADVDGDGCLEVLAVAAKTGELLCYRCRGAADADAVPWPTSRGSFDSRANRLVPVSTPVPRPAEAVGTGSNSRTSPEALRLGVNDVAYESAEGSLVEIATTGPDSITRRSVVGDAGRVGTPLEILDAGDYDIVARALDADSGATLGISLERLNVDAFTDLLDEASGLLDELAPLCARDPSIRRLLGLRRQDIGERAASYASLDRDGRREFIAEADALGAAMRREVACQRARIADEADSEGPVEFLPWLVEHPWSPMDEDANAPEGELLNALDIRTDGAGHEAAAIQIANLLPTSLDVRAWFDPLKAQDDTDLHVADHLKLRRVTRVPTPSGGMGADALPELGNAGLITLPPSSSARLWIDVTTGALAPGTYTTTLHMRPLTQAGTVRDVPVTWIVAATALPEAMPVHFCNWGYGMASKFSHVREVALEDMQDHYTSVFTSFPMPRSTYDADGNILESTGWEEIDWYLERMRPQNIALLPAYPLTPAEGAPEKYSDAWKKAFATLLPQWVAHLRSKGFGYDRWAFYPVDEPGLHGGILIQELERYARFVKSLDAEVQIYTDPYRGMTVADHERMVDVVDIVQPTQHYVVEAETTDRIDYLRTTDQTHWIYEARAGVKDDIHPVYYWEQIWTAWEIGFTGVGYWTYCTTGFDLWEAAADYVMVYQGSDGPVPSVRWQAIRIGIEDYARMARLRDAIAGAREAGRMDVAEQAEQRLEEVVSEAKAALWDPAVVARIRSEIIDLTLDLTA